MDPATFLVYGEPIDVEIDGRTYTAFVKDIGHENNISISEPMQGKSPMFIPPRATLKIVYYRPNGMYEFDAVNAGTGMNDAERFIKLEILGDPQKYQRRTNFRVPMSIALSVRVLSEPEDDASVCEFETESIDFSEAGMCIYSPMAYPLGTLMKLEFCAAFGSSTESFSLDAQLARCTWPKSEAERYRIGMKFLDIDEATHRLLSKVIIQEQIRLRKEGR